MVRRVCRIQIWSGDYQCGEKDRKAIEDSQIHSYLDKRELFRRDIVLSGTLSFAFFNGIT
jgi:hypothetical protein